MNKVSIRVPATSANCGSGFDTLGLACTLYNEVTYEITSTRGFQLEVTGEGAEYLKPCGRNLAFASFFRVWNEVTDRERIGLKITMHNRIPMSRGLGSSSSAIVAGIFAGNILSGNRFNDDELLGFATEIEGHPDNVAPAILGGLVLSSQEDDGSVSYFKMNWPEDWDLTVCIPDFELSTEIARSVLPKEVPMQDAIYNTKHLAMMLQAISEENPKLMKASMKDRLHQPYREKLVPGMHEIMEAFKHEDGVLGCVLSGAGPSMLVISHKYDVDKIKSIVKDIWESQNINVDVEISNLWEIEQILQKFYKRKK